MTFGFPVHIPVQNNNCIVFGGNELAYHRTVELLKFGAKVTVISPFLCEPLSQLDQQRAIRHIPRKYIRGDCSFAVMCVAATDNSAMNIAISEECKAKKVPVNVTDPPEYGTFSFPVVANTNHIMVSIVGSPGLDEDKLLKVRDAIQRLLNQISDI